MRHGIISSCQSAATSETVSALAHESDSCKQRYGKYPTFTFTFIMVLQKLTFFFLDMSSSSSV